MDRYYAICSAPDCAFSAAINPSEGFCPRCGSGLIEQCPACKAYLRHRDMRFCADCGERLKPEPPPAS